MTSAKSADTKSADPLAVAASFTSEIFSRADEAEAARKYPQDLIERMAQAGLFRLCNPRALDGLEQSPSVLAEVIECLAKADASAAWIAFIGVSSMVHLAGFDAKAAEVMLADPNTKAAGVFAPRGKAVPATRNGEAGYLLSGRWQWGSGSQNCDWLTGGGFVVGKDGKPVTLPSGRLDQRSFAMRRDQVEFLDTWSVSGLNGTGSTDFQVKDMFVPEHFTSNFFDPPRRTETVFVFPPLGFLAIGIAATALGIARASIDELLSFASAKTPEGSRRKLALKPGAQRAVAEAEALLRSSRLYLFDSIERAWSHAEANGETTIDLRRDLRLAMTHTTRTCAEVVRKMYEIGGGTSVYRTSRLQKHFRDIHVATQHIMVGPETLELTGRLLLGVETDTAML